MCVADRPDAGTAMGTQLVARAASQALLASDMVGAGVPLLLLAEPCKPIRFTEDELRVQLGLSHSDAAGGASRLNGRSLPAEKADRPAELFTCSLSAVDSRCEPRDMYCEGFRWLIRRLRSGRGGSSVSREERKVAIAFTSWAFNARRWR